MCRFAVYSGPPLRLASLVTEPEHSIIHQSVESREGIDRFNGDGYGLAWYVPHLQPEPVVFREITPAWNSPNLHSLAGGVESGLVFAHVRAATTGLAVTQLNCHPFARGPLAFMHNGEIGGFRRIHRALRRQLSDEAYEAIQGTTDSEHFFAWTTDHWQALADRPPLERLVEALCRTLAAVDALRRELGAGGPCRMNTALTDGRHVVVSRCNLGDAGGLVNSLYVRRGDYPREHVRPAAAAAGEPCVMIASEPLSADGGWERVPENHLVLVDAERRVTLRPLDLPAA